MAAASGTESGAAAAVGCSRTLPPAVHVTAARVDAFEAATAIAAPVSAAHAIPAAAIARTSTITSATALAGADAVAAATITAVAHAASVATISGATPVAALAAVSTADPVTVAALTALSRFAATEVITRPVGLLVTEFLSRSLVAVGGIAAVLGVVLPSVAGIHVVPGVVAIYVGGPVDIDVDVAAPPVAAAEDCPCSREADAPGEAAYQCLAGIPVGNAGVVVGRVGGVRPRAINHRRIVGRHVNGLRLRGLDDDGLRFGLHHLLRVALEVAVVLGQLAHALNRVEHILLLAKECIPQLLGPVELLVHHLEHVGEGHERLDADVPRLVLDQLECGIALGLGMGL